MTAVETATESIVGAGPASFRDAAPATRRDRFDRWFVTHEVAWELAMAAQSDCSVTRIRARARGI